MKKIDNARLVIAGPAEEGYQKILEKMVKNLGIENKVLFTGFIGAHDKKMTFIDADIFVNVRQDEIFGLVFLEANACGTPVICSKGCGIANVIDGETGIAVSYNEDQVENAIIKILNNDNLRKRFGEKGKKLVMEKFGWDSVVRTVDGIYEDCIYNI